jgi:hypothetical protein
MAQIGPPHHRLARSDGNCPNCASALQEPGKPRISKPVRESSGNSGSVHAGRVRPMFVVRLVDTDIAPKVVLTLVAAEAFAKNAFGDGEADRAEVCEIKVPQTWETPYPVSMWVNARYGEL